MADFATLSDLQELIPDVDPTRGAQALSLASTAVRAHAVVALPDPATETVPDALKLATVVLAARIALAGSGREPIVETVEGYSVTLPAARDITDALAIHPDDLTGRLLSAWISPDLYDVNVGPDYGGVLTWTE